MRAIYSPDVDQVRPTRMRDLTPAKASLLRAVDRYQRALLMGWGGVVCGNSTHIGANKATASGRISVRVPPGAIRLGFRALIEGVGAVRFAVDEAALLYTDLRGWGGLIGEIWSASWVASHTDPATLSALTAARGAGIPLAPVLVWRTISVTVSTPADTYVYGIEPLIAFVDDDLDEAAIEWGGAESLAGGSTNVGMSVPGWATRWARSEWRTLIVRINLTSKGLTGWRDTILKFTGTGSASMTLELANRRLTLTTKDAGGTTRRAVAMTAQLGYSDGVDHQLIITWREDVTTGAAVYVDGVADTLATNTATSPVDLGAALTQAVLCAHTHSQVRIAEVAHLWGTMTSDEVEEVWRDGAPRRDLALTSVGRRIMEYWCVDARDSSASFANLGTEPSWQRVTEGVGTSVVTL